MKTYHKDHASVLVALSLAILTFAVAFWLRDLRPFWLASFFCYAAFFERSVRVTVDAQELSMSIAFFPFLPSWCRTVKWDGIHRIQVFQNIAFVEADALVVSGRLADGKTQQLMIPIAVLAKRKEFLNDLANHLPPHLQLAPEVRRWAETVGTTPRWQLIVALLILLLLAGIAWWSFSRI